MGHVTLESPLDSKIYRRWLGSPLYWGQERNRIPRDQEVWLRRPLPFDCNGEIAPLFLFPKYDGCLQGGFGERSNPFAILLRVRPQVLFSKGGFVSVPPVIAARLTSCSCLYP